MGARTFSPLKKGSLQSSSPNLFASGEREILSMIIASRWLVGGPVAVFLLDFFIGFGIVVV
jgi:hypothetical protein